MKKQTILCLLQSLLAVPAELAQEVLPAASQTFSRLAFGGGISLMGVHLQAAVNDNRYLNIRGTGNVFSYSVQNIAVDGGNGANGINASGSLNFIRNFRADGGNFGIIRSPIRAIALLA